MVAAVTFKDLCLDAEDPARLGSFWATVLGRTQEVLPNGDVVLRGDRPTDTIWVNAVPEPKTVKHRVHLDVEIGSLQPLLDAGASLLRPQGDDGIRWAVLADVEGGEFCAFVRDHVDPDEPARLVEIVVDVADTPTSKASVQWWADVFDATAEDDGRPFWWVSDIPGSSLEAIVMIPVPEPKTVKNRIHWDVQAVDSTALGHLRDRGATVLAAPSDDVSWHVLADPWGNEFCLFPPSP